MAPVFLPPRSGYERQVSSIKQPTVNNVVLYHCNYGPCIVHESDWLEKTHVCDCLRKISGAFNLLNPTGHLMHQQFNIQQLYVLPTLYLCVLYLSEKKQRLVTLTA